MRIFMLTNYANANIIPPNIRKWIIPRNIIKSTELQRSKEVTESKQKNNTSQKRNKPKQRTVSEIRSNIISYTRQLVSIGALQQTIVKNIQKEIENF